MPMFSFSAPPCAPPLALSWRFHPRERALGNRQTFQHGLRGDNPRWKANAAAALELIENRTTTAVATPVCAYENAPADVTRATYSRSRGRAKTTDGRWAGK